MEKTPYIIRFLEALNRENYKEAEKVMREFFPECSSKILAVAGQFHRGDLPLVVAAMKVTIQALTTIMGKSEKEASDRFASSINVSVINLDELKRQMKEDSEGE